MKTKEEDFILEQGRERDFEDKDEEFRDNKGNYIMCPICGSKEHTDGRCEAGEIGDN